MKQLTQLDIWVLSTYQRLERMDAPIFDVIKSRNIFELRRTTENADIYRLPTDLPRHSQSLADRAAGKACENFNTLNNEHKISLFFRYLSSALRFEPHNENPVHKAVPSARCMYPLRFILVTKSNNEISSFEYKPDFHALQPVEIHDEAIKALAYCDAAVICLSNNWVSAEKYGEFAHFPCLLEGGHALSQLSHLAALLDWRTDVDIPRSYGAPYCQGEFEIPLFITALNTGDISHITRLPKYSGKIAKMAEVSGLSQRFPRLVYINQLFNKDKSLVDAPSEELSVGQTYAINHVENSKSILSSSVAIPDIDVLALMRARHSGNNRGGVAAILKHLEPNQLLKIINLWRDISQMRQQVSAERTLSVAFGWLSSSGPRVGLYNSDGELLTPDVSPQDFAARMKATLPYKEMRFNTSSLAMTFIISSDPIEAITEHGDAALRDMLLAAGAAAQDLSYAATAYGMFARPVRMMREERIESSFPIKGQVLYQVLCGFNRRSNLTFEVL